MNIKIISFCLFLSAVPGLAKGFYLQNVPSPAQKAVVMAAQGQAARPS